MYVLCLLRAVSKLHCKEGGESREPLISEGGGGVGGLGGGGGGGGGGLGWGFLSRGSFCYNSENITLPGGKKTHYLPSRNPKTPPKKKT